ncbi:MAG: ribonuclease P protein component [Nitrospirae bacterium]|nr:ribonuclease P protein component [Nitrospirota bacterium]
MPLRKKGDFDKVFELGLKFPSQYLVIYAKPNGLSFCRLGLAVSRKTGNAVSRNRTKRRLREIVRKQLLNKSLAFDFVVVARRGASEAVFVALSKAFTRCLFGLADEKHTDSDNKTL